MDWKGIVSHKKELVHNQNDATFISIPILGDKIRKLLGFLFTYFHSLSFASCYGMIYGSLESLFHVEYKAIDIVEIGPVVMEIFMY